MSNKYTSPEGCRFFFGKEVSNVLIPGYLTDLYLDIRTSESETWTVQKSGTNKDSKNDHVYVIAIDSPTTFEGRIEGTMTMRCDSGVDLLTDCIRWISRLILNI